MAEQDNTVVIIIIPIANKYQICSVVSTDLGECQHPLVGLGLVKLVHPQLITAAKRHKKGSETRMQY